jgi:uncharacterized protein involved in exopolysaccharide biosynthesis
MEIRIRNAAGVVLLLTGVPALAQEASALKATTPANCASCPPPPPPPSVVTPTDPTWFVAGFVVGLVLGIVVTKVFSKKQ